MATTTTPSSSPPPPPPLLPIARRLVTPHGSTISYRQVGAASPARPGLIYVHGGLEDWHGHLELAQCLSPSYTVYLPDRRGRGLSSPHEKPGPGAGSTLEAETADLAALARHTGARLVGGVSAGALVVLQTMLAHPGCFDAAAVYEPPGVLRRPGLKEHLAQFQAELARGDMAGALLAAFRVVETGPPLVLWTPSPLQRPLVRLLMMLEDRLRQSERDKEMRDDAAARAAGLVGNAEDEVPEAERQTEPLPTMRNLAPSIALDFRSAGEAAAMPMERFAALGDGDGGGGDKDKDNDKDDGDGRQKVRVLLMSGTRTRPFLVEAIEMLGTFIPGSKHVRLPGLDHLGTGNKMVGGRPELVAETLDAFFSKRAEVAEDPGEMV